MSPFPVWSFSSGFQYEYENLSLEQHDSAISKLGSSSIHIRGNSEMSSVALRIPPSGMEEIGSKKSPSNEHQAPH